MTVELDAIVAGILGWGIVLHDQITPPFAQEILGWVSPDKTEHLPEPPAFSTDMNAAMVAWGWLEANHPWELIALRRDPETDKPCVGVVADLPKEWGEGSMLRQFKIRGETYAEAICQAVIRANEERP